MATDAEDVIIELSSNEFKTLIHVTKSTIQVLSNAKGALKTSIQQQTQTKITCSEVKVDGTTKRFVEVKGSSHKDVYTARQQIKSYKNDGQKRDVPTHFTCVKITNSVIKENFLKFKKENLKSVSSSPWLESIFMKPKKLHLTFGVMNLSADGNGVRAEEVLNDCLEKIIKPIKHEYNSIEMKVRGIGIMNGNPEKARVVYAKVESEALQKIANGIAKCFVDAGLGKKERNRDIVKLHMTLLNVKYSRGKRNTFDAKQILEQYSDFEFGSQEVKQILLVSMDEKDPNGFYKCIASIDC